MTRLNNQITSKMMHLYPVIVRSLFCIHGLTSGVVHAGVRRKATFCYQCGGRPVTEGCTEERVDLGGTGSSYYGMCYRNAPSTLATKDKRKCVWCQDWVVISVWNQSVLCVGSRGMLSAIVKLYSPSTKPLYCLLISQP